MSKESTKAAFQKAYSDHVLLNLSDEDIRIMNTYYKLDEQAEAEDEKTDS